MASLVRVPAASRPAAGRPQRRGGKRTGRGVLPAAAASLVDVAPRPGAATPAADAARARLLQSAAGLDRGAAATPSERAAVERAVVALEALAAEPGSPPPLARAPGAWRLAYSSVEPFRSSPFFWGFASAFGLPAASAIFAFTDAIPGAVVGPARQVLALSGGGGDDGTLRSDVALTVATLLTGSVVTSATLRRVPDGDGGWSGTDLDVSLIDTRVERSSIAPGLVGSVAVPVGEAFGRLQRGRGGGAGGGGQAIRLKISYCDDVVRVARVEGEGSLFVYVRE